MSNVTLIGIDLAKSIFQVCGVDEQLKPVFNRQVRRAQLTRFVERYPGVPICMEACSGSNYWGRQFMAQGHDVTLIPPQHVKPFVKGNKNDAKDALAICEASRRPNMRTVEPRSLEQTDCVMSHRVRERRMQQRIQVTNQIRGVLNEYGLVFRQGPSALRTGLEGALEDVHNALSPQARELLDDLLNEWLMLDAQIKRCDQRIREHGKHNSVIQRLQTIHGVGELISSAAWAVLGTGGTFHSGRCFAANLGLVPREHSSGGKQRLGAITKRGDRYLRKLLVQASQNVLRYAANHPQDRLSVWAAQVAQRRGHHKAVVAVANKLARIIWAVVEHGQPYRPAGLPA